MQKSLGKYNIETTRGTKISVAIGLTGEVNGDITAYRVLVAGKVNGNIYAAERVEFHKDAVVNGDISYGSIAVEHGARLLGMVIQNKASSQSANRAKEAIENAQSKSGTGTWLTQLQVSVVQRKQPLSANEARPSKTP